MLEGQHDGMQWRMSGIISSYRTSRDHTQLELPFINKEELAGNEIINGSIGCSDHEVDYEDPAVSEEGK